MNSNKYLKKNLLFLVSVTYRFLTLRFLAYFEWASKVHGTYTSTHCSTSQAINIWTLCAFITLLRRKQNLELSYKNVHLTCKTKATEAAYLNLILNICRRFIPFIAYLPLRLNNTQYFVISIFGNCYFCIFFIYFT